MGAAPDAELLAGLGPQGAELATGSHGGAGTLEANNTGVTHVGKGEVLPRNLFWGQIFHCPAGLCSQAGHWLYPTCPWLLAPARVVGGGGECAPSPARSHTG